MFAAIALVLAMMNLTELNSRYGAPSRIVFHEGFAGYPNVVLANKYGTAEVALLGGNVLSYRPTGHGPVVFRPAGKDSDYNRGDKFHGGIPLCWPQFGNRFDKSLPQHGFASKLVFEVRGTEYSEELTEVTLGLKASDETRKLWPHDFDLELKVSVSMKLNLKVTTTNSGSTPLAFSCGFHPYFRVSDPAKTFVRGLDGCKYIDASGAALREDRQSGDFSLKGVSPDHVFFLPSAPKHELALMDEGLNRAIAVVAAGNTRAVVWNPGTAYVVDGQSADDWKKFVCVEPVSDWPDGRTLQPGEKHELLVSIQSTLKGVAE